MGSTEKRPCAVVYNIDDVKDKHSMFAVQMLIPADTYYCVTGPNISRKVREGAEGAIRAQFAKDANEQHGNEVWRKDQLPEWELLTFMPGNVDRDFELPPTTERFYGGA